VAGKLNLIGIEQWNRKIAIYFSSPTIGLFSLQMQKDNHRQDNPFGDFLYGERGASWA
jgi:hypothetical protein